MSRRNEWYPHLLDDRCDYCRLSGLTRSPYQIPLDEMLDRKTMRLKPRYVNVCDKCVASVTALGYSSCL